MNDLIKSVKGTLGKYTPEILITTGVIGYGLSLVLTAKAAKKTDAALKEADKYTVDKSNRKAVLVGQFNHLLPIYAPAVSAFMLSTACVVGAHTVSKRRQAAVVGLYTIAERTIRSYEKHITKELSNDQAAIIENNVRTDRLEYATNSPIAVAPARNLYFDTYTGRYFEGGSLEDIRGVQNTLNERLMSEMFIPVNDLYYELGLEPTGAGDQIGWDIGHGHIEFKFATKMVVATGAGVTPMETPCVVIDYVVQPRHYN